MGQSQEISTPTHPSGREWLLPIVWLQVSLHVELQKNREPKVDLRGGGDTWQGGPCHCGPEKSGIFSVANLLPFSVHRQTSSGHRNGRRS